MIIIWCVQIKIQDTQATQATQGFTTSLANGFTRRKHFIADEKNSKMHQTKELSKPSSPNPEHNRILQNAQWILSNALDCAWNPPSAQTSHAESPMRNEENNEGRFEIAFKGLKLISYNQKGCWYVWYKSLKVILGPISVFWKSTFGKHLGIYFIFFLTCL